MGIFNHTGEKEEGDSACIINVGIIASEYVRKSKWSITFTKEQTIKQIFFSAALTWKTII